MFLPSFNDFKKLAKSANVIPIYRDVIGDLETPVSTYLKLTTSAKTRKYSCLLESVEGGEKIGRFSFIAIEPFLIFTTNKNEVTLIEIDEEKTKTQHFKSLNPYNELRKIFKRFSSPASLDLPRFYGGTLGYISYEAIRYFENIPITKENDLQLPELFFIFPKTLIIFDHVNHKIKILTNAVIKSKHTNLEKIYKQSCKEINNIIDKINKTLPYKKLKFPQNIPTKSLLTSNFTKKEYISAVSKTKEYIMAGDIIQAVISQRFSTEINIPPFDIYRALRVVNPSPYMYYLNFDYLKIIGSSPELLVRKEGNIIETRPIAGTRKRGKTPEEDEKLTNELLADEKEKAEHIMLVDLSRNDIGKVARFGSISVPELMIIEKYSHVQHIVSSVKGILNRGKDAFDSLISCFPAGTVTGAPKIRAMEIINELEPCQRGPYAGAVGYFGFNDNMDMAITIRTIIVKNKTAYLQAGAGIVADSIPEREYKETLNKLKVLFTALKIAEKKLQL